MTRRKNVFNQLKRSNKLRLIWKQSNVKVRNDEKHGRNKYKKHISNDKHFIRKMKKKKKNTD